MMLRLFLLLLPLLLPACSGGQEGEAARAALESHRASLQVLGAVPPARPSPVPPPVPAVPPVVVPGRLADGPAPRLASQFLGASPEALLAALGEPALRREEGGAAVWLYASSGCQLDVVFYRGAQGPRVEHVQARAGGLAQRTEAACLRDIATQAPPGAAGSPGNGGARPAPELGA